MRETDSIGARIAAARKLRGLTQQQLSTRANLSLSLIKKVEGGQRAATPGVVAAVARALRVEHTRLTGQPFLDEGGPLTAVHELIPALRQEMGLYGLPPDTDEPARPLAELGARVREGSQLLNAAGFARLGELLPDLLADLRAASFAYTGPDRSRIMLWLTETLDNAKRFAWDLGYPDLGLLAVRLEDDAARESGDRLAVAVAAGVRAWTLTSGGAFNPARNLLVDVLDEMPDPNDEAAWSVWGFLNLQAALASARMGDTARVWEHHAAAERAAGHLDDEQADHYQLTFSRANTAVWGVGLAVEMMDGPAAIARAENLTIPAWLPRARAGHHFMDLARAHLYAGRPELSLRCLLTARDVAPQQLRHHPMARETLHALARVERRRSDSLRNLAAWVGLQD